jgi:outer membrane protein OmpA-like peptidoglycan-associated protein/Tol biopolymer transport system component
MQHLILAFRSVFLVLIFLCYSMISAAQRVQYSTQDKKLIKAYEQSLQHYNRYELDKALAILNKLTAKNKTFAEPFMMRAQIYAETGKTREAISDLEHVTTTYPEYYHRNYFFLGELYFSLAEYHDALRNYLLLMQFPERDEMIVHKNDLGIRSCQFAMHSSKHPVPFKPENMGPGVNTDMDEYYPVLTADGNTLVFTRQLVDGRGNKQEDFFVSSRSPEGWSKSKPIVEINTPMNEGAPTLSADGRVLIFTACELDGMWGGTRTGLGSCDLFFSRKTGDKWSDPRNLGPAINSTQWESQPSFSADGKTLYFVRGKRGPRGHTDSDIWQSTLGADGKWTKAERIPGKVNTPFNEESVFIHPDGKTLYFSSDGHPGLGGLDIFVSFLNDDGTWGEPVNLGYPVNTSGNENSLLVGPSGEIAYFASDREGGFGGLDLYQFEMPTAARPTPVTYTKGTVRDVFSFKKLEARFELIDLSTGKTVIESESDPVTGEFLVALPTGVSYALNVSRPGYLFYSHNFTLPKGMPDKPYELEVRLSKMEPGQKVVLNNVFFDTGLAELKPESRVELEKVAAMMKGNSGMKVEIGGHTDDVGKEKDNQILSENRAKAVRDFLIGLGVDSSRLTAVGYGMTKPIVTNKTPEGRAQNRRTEFMVVEM